MRSDYALYVVAIICFIAAVYTAVITTETQLYISALAILGIIFIGLGYMARPKKATHTSATAIPSPPPPEPPSETVQPKTELKEEPKKPATKKRARKKRTTRRRKKKT
jgi:hypothetical protein